MAQEMCGKKWALLVAGSKGWTNYRHQANVCCLYQIIKKQGIPDDQIVVMMYDDIANNPKNLHPGNIVSAVSEMLNVYPGVPKDYTGKDVNPTNFLNALQGNKTSKKIITSGPDDKIFIYMSTTGGNGTFAFPDESLSASDLKDAISKMRNDKKFSKMVIYMDSDYSATMLKEFPQNINVYAVSSCDEDKKNIPTDPDSSRGVNLSDQFSAALLRLLYMFDLNRAKFKHLFGILFHFDTRSPRQFGDMNIRNDLLGEFLQK